MQKEVGLILHRLLYSVQSAPKQEFAEVTFGSEQRFAQFRHLISMDRTSDVVLTGITETSLFNAHFQWFIMTVCAALMMENKGAIHVGHRGLLSADRLCDFEQVYVLPCPIWPWYISQPAICPVLYLSQWNSHVLVCACVCVCVLLLAVVFQVKLVLYNHGCVSSPPAHQCTRIPASDIDPRSHPPSQHTHIYKH